MKRRLEVMKKIISLILTLVLILSLAAPSVLAASPIVVKVNGSKVTFPDSQPVIKDGRTLVPLRAVFEKLGADVEWDQPTKTASITLKSNTLKIKIGSEDLHLNNKKISQKLDVKAQLIDSRTMIPLRYACEALGYTVNWDSGTRTVTVNGNGLSANQAYYDAEAIFKTIGTTKSEAGAYFKDSLNIVSNLKQSLNEMDAATKKADFIYSAGFLVIDATNIATSVKSALDEGGEAVYDAITDAQETMLEYTDSSESMSVSDWFVASGKASYSNYLELSQNLLDLHINRIEKGYFTYSEALSYSVTYYLMQIDRKTLSTAVSLLIDNAADGIFSGIALTAKKFTFNLLPGSLGDNIQMMLNMGGSTMQSYYAAMNDYKSKLSKLLY